MARSMRGRWTCGLVYDRRAMMIQAVWRVVLGLGVVALACGEIDEQGDDGTPAGPDAAPDPSAWGPYPVGVQTWVLHDHTRGADGPRPVLTEVWYPATAAAVGGKTVTYRLEDILRDDALALLNGEVEAELKTEAVRDAAWRLADGPYPVVFFSHGSGGIRMQSTYLTVHLASHGYVVVSPDHDGNTLSDLLVDGGQPTEVLLQAFQDRPVDLDFLHAHLTNLAADDPVRGAIDLERVGVAGHSFGALTSIRWMGLGANVRAVVAQAPPSMDLVWLGQTRKLAEFDVPLMLHVGGMDDTTPPADAESIWEEASAPRSRLTLARAGHFTFSDMCSLDAETIVGAADIGVPDAIREDCGPDRTPGDLAALVLRHYAIGHFNAYLRDSPPSLALLTEAAGIDLAGAEVTFEIEH
jgi:predicted dienelactone hydrolase